MTELIKDGIDRTDEDPFAKMLGTHPALQHVRLKKLNGHGFQYNLQSCMCYIDCVNWWDFICPEHDRLPLLIVNRAGLWPKSINYQMLFKESKTIALFHCAYLSAGAALAFDVYRLPAGWHYDTPFDRDYIKYKIDY